jgi:hypothetical protein
MKRSVGLSVVRSHYVCASPASNKASISPDDTRSLHEYASIPRPCLQTLFSTHRKCIPKGILEQDECLS